MACGKSTSQKRLTEPSLSRFGLGERLKDSLVNNHINLRRGKKKSMTVGLVYAAKVPLDTVADSMSSRNPRNKIIPTMRKMHLWHNSEAALQSQPLGTYN